ncbi:vacuolar protein sorting-associated protein 45 [Savitreella phatthalungensis]
MSSIVAICQNYVDKALQGDGVKCLLVDDDTKVVLSLIYTQSQLLEKHVYLTERLEKPRERLAHLQCIAIVRPTAANIKLLEAELRNPRYAAYRLVFTNALSRESVEQLAESDTSELVTSVIELYLDFCALGPHLFTLAAAPRPGPSIDVWNPTWLERTSQGLIAALLALKKRPLIRFERNSPLARRLADIVSHFIAQHKLFDFPRTDTNAILLIVDRRNDPVTPFLTQWTYQAMVHDLLGLENGQTQGVPLTADTDPFFAQNMYLNFGDLGDVLKSYVESYQQRTDSNRNLETVADMKRFIEAYPEFRKLSGNVSKHVNLMSELSRLVAERNLLDVSEVEQSLVCGSGDSVRDLDSVNKLLTTTIPDELKLRLASLYALRHGPAHDYPVLRKLMTSYGTARRQGDLFPRSDLFSKARSGLRGIQNVYTQHRPLLESTLLDLSRGKLSLTLFPAIDGADLPTDRPQEAIVFMVGGGCTYEESKCCAEINQAVRGFRCTLGAEQVINAEGWLDWIGAAGES